MNTPDEHFSTECKEKKKTFKTIVIIKTIKTKIRFYKSLYTFMFLWFYHMNLSTYLKEKNQTFVQ